MNTSCTNAACAQISVTLNTTTGSIVHKREVHIAVVSQALSSEADIGNFLTLTVTHLIEEMEQDPHC